MFVEYDSPLMSIVYIVILVVPFLLPRLFWKQRRNKRVKVIFYDVDKASDNPFMEEPTTVAFYDPDEQVLIEATDIYENDSYDEICKLFDSISKTYDRLYLVTFDTDHKSLCFKVMLEDVLEGVIAHKCKVCFMDIRTTFLHLHPVVPSIRYEEMMDYYKVPPHLDCPPLECCALFEQLILDFDVDIREDMGKLHALYLQTNPLLT